MEYLVKELQKEVRREKKVVIMICVWRERDYGQRNNKAGERPEKQVTRRADSGIQRRCRERASGGSVRSELEGCVVDVLEEKLSFAAV